jgi:hypothetical protein
VPLRSLEQLFVTEHSGSEGPTTYRLQARLKNGERLTLVDALKTEAHARGLERAIEAHLGIVDRLVDGEHRAAP